MSIPLTQTVTYALPLDRVLALEVATMAILFTSVAIAYWLGGAHEYRRVVIALVRAGIPIPDDARPAASRRLRHMINRRTRRAARRRQLHRNVQIFRADHQPFTALPDAPTQEFNMR